MSLESIYYTAYKTRAFLDGRKIFRELISVVLLYWFDHQSKYFSEQEILPFLMTETKILKSLLQLFVVKIITLMWCVFVGSIKGHLKEGCELMKCEIAGTK